VWQFNRIPNILFGVGSRHRLLACMSSLGKRVLLVTGEGSFDRQPDAQILLDAWQASGLTVLRETLASEPTTDWVDACVTRHASSKIEVVVAIGGGSAIDAAKALAGLLPVQTSVMAYLEGVGPELPYTGNALPFIAVPTTAGTGAEATKNAVISRQGVDGFKKSFRHDSLMPSYAVIDPEWMLSLSRQQIAANGLDAITQLIEGYTSTNASVMTDALARDGLARGLLALPKWVADPTDVNAATDMAWAALASGIVLAHAGLGAVHGMASPLGAFFPAPHGAVCGVLLAETTAVNIDTLFQGEENALALQKYADIGRLMLADQALSDHSALVLLVEALRQWQSDFKLRGLAEFGMLADDIPRIVANSRGNSMKTNPITLSDAQLTQILTRCL